MWTVNYNESKTGQAISKQCGPQPRVSSTLGIKYDAALKYHTSVPIT